MIIKKEYEELTKEAYEMTKLIMEKAKNVGINTNQISEIGFSPADRYIHVQITTGEGTNYRITTFGDDVPKLEVREA